jgi:para-aminobenzoate synthetase component 1
MISDRGAVQLNIAIRTLLLSNETMDYWAGAGIVADSDPEAEFRETLDKAAVVRSLCNCPSEPTLA